MQSPGTAVRGVLGAMHLPDLVGPGCSGPIQAPGTVVRGSRPAGLAGSGGSAMPPVAGLSMLSVRWAGGQPAVGLSGKPPAALVDRPMMGSAQQHQVVQIGGAAVQPVPQMMRVTPGKGPLAVGEDTAAVPDREGAALGGGDDPAGPAHIQG